MVTIEDLFSLQFGNNPFSALGGNSDGSGVQPSRTENREPLPNPWGPPNAANPSESGGGTTGGPGATTTAAGGTTPSVSNPLGINAASLGNGKRSWGTREMCTLEEHSVGLHTHTHTHTHTYTLTPSFLSLCTRDVQQSRHAEPNAADLGEPPADAEHAVCSVHAQHDAVPVSES